MMGYNHAISGAAAWVAVTSVAQDFPAYPLVTVEPLHMVTGAVVCAGAALLPDADHHNATIAHSVPVVGKVAAGTAGALTGGHRHGLHSILAIVGIWFATGWIGGVMWQPEWWSSAIPAGAAITTAALIGFAVKAIKIVKKWSLAWIIGIVTAAVLALFLPDDLGWFQICVTLGFTVHIIGDFLTKEGINWFWPLKIRAPKLIQKIPIINEMWKGNGYFALPIIRQTGNSIVETLLGALLALYAVAGLAVNLLGGFILP